MDATLDATPLTATPAVPVSSSDLAQFGGSEADVLLKTGGAGRSRGKAGLSSLLLGFAIAGISATSANAADNSPSRRIPAVLNPQNTNPQSIPQPDIASTTGATPPVRIAQNNPPKSNRPAAVPQEQPNGLEVPIDNNKTPTRNPSDKGTPTPATANPAPAPAPAPTGPVVTTPPVDVPTVQTPLPEAEGREISDVRVVGNRVVPPETILAKVRTQRGAAYSSRQIETDRRQIGSIGLFASVQAQVSPDVAEANKVVVTFIVVENRVITAFKFSGNTLVPTTDILKVLESQVGTVLNSETMNRDVQSIQKLYSDRGFGVLVKSAQQQEDGSVEFTLQEAHISQIKISGLKKTSEGLVRKQIRVKPGDPFDSTKLRKDLNRLYDMGFFEDVTFKVDDDPDVPGSIIVTFLIKEKRTGQLSLGIGFDSRSQLSGFVSLQENNLRGRGQKGLVSVETGSERNYEVGYGNPFVGDKNASYDLSLYSRTIFREPSLVERLSSGTVTDNSSNVTYEERRTGGRINFTDPLDIDRNRTLLFGYRNERAKLFQRDSSGDVQPVTTGNKLLDSSGTVSAASVGLLRDRRDLRLDPSSGSRQQLILEQAFKFIGGTTNFTKVDADFRNYIPLIHGAKPGDQAKMVFASRVVAGFALNQLPAFEQYYIGGSDTVRGYDSDTQYGDNQVYGNLEIRYRFNRQFQVVGFTDAGKAYGGDFTSSSGTLYSFGAGVRVQTPVGPIRLDVGQGKDGVRTHFGIGPTF